MYTPKAFQMLDESLIFRIIDDHSFATVISQNHISHLPLLRKTDSKHISLFSHLSRHNPQCSDLTPGAQVRAIFHGPHTYITPTWYTENDVPTWNYVSVHVTGTVTRVESSDELEKILKATAHFYENKYQSKWEFQLPPDLSPMEDVPQWILGFELKVTDIQAKFKLNQNRSRQDQAQVISGLKTDRTDDNSLAIAQLMEELNMRR